MFAANSFEMHEIDKRAFEKYKIPTLLLMENAAMAITNFIKDRNEKNILFVCGPGNNGGDGFASARQLIVENFDVEILFLGDEKKLKGDAKLNYDILANTSINIENNIENIDKLINKCDIIIDCIFGTGLARDVEGMYYKAIYAMNNSKKYILSVDIPSGINSDTGDKHGICVYANSTITFGCLKIGNIIGEGRVASKEVVLNKISIPKECIDEQKIKVTTNWGNYPQSLLYERKIESNKGDFGKIHIYGGNNLMSGAVILCAKAAYRAGAGLINCVIPESILNRVGSCVTEATYTACKEQDGCINPDINTLSNTVKNSDVTAFGVGIGKSKNIEDALRYLLRNSNVPIVIDADGLNNLCQIKNELINKKCEVVITPHPGEMARLTGLDIPTIIKNKVNVAVDFAKEYNCIVLLKGASTVVTDGNEVFINTSGNPGMASAGSGDTLTGIISALIGQGYSALNAAIIGVYLHGRAGDLAFEKYGYGLKADDIAEFTGAAYKDISKN